MKENPRIVFYGTPEFAVASLDRIVEEGYTVAGVITAPDRPAGRGLHDQVSAVKTAALRHGIPVFQPLNMKDPGFMQQLESLKPDLQVVIAFRMMPRQVWAMPPLGTFNLHASLLPQYRGAAPINWAIINGETETGVTTFFLNDQIDTGKIILREKVPIGPDETAGSLHDRLMITGSRLVIGTIRAITEGRVTEVSQESLSEPDALLKPAPKLFREDCRINWDQPAGRIHNFIRGLSPSPGAWSLFPMPDGTETLYKVYRSTPESGPVRHSPGVAETDGKSMLKIAAMDGYIHLDILQLSGRKVMNTGDFLRGFGHHFTETRDK